jgi:hypothetical protein
VVNYDVDHSGENNPRISNFTESSEPRSLELNESHQMWEMHGDRWMRIGGSNAGQI